MEKKQKYLDFNWHLAQFKPNCAMIAEQNLTRQGFEVFIPLEKQTRNLRGKFVEEIKPFFPGYMFVRLTKDSADVNTVRSTYGVSQLVRFGTKVASVSAQLVEELKIRCNSDGVMKLNEDLEKGATVRIAYGPFADLVGEVERMTPAHRVWLLLDVMGHRTKVSVARSALKAKT